jgi:hypothetical protein
MRWAILLVLIGIALAIMPLFLPDPPGLPVVDLRSRDFRFSISDTTGTIDDVPWSLRTLDGRLVVVTGTPVPMQTDPSIPWRAQIVWFKHSLEMEGPPLVQERVFTTPVPKSPAARSAIALPAVDSIVDAVGTFHVRIVRDPKTQRISSVFTLDAEQIAPGGSYHPPVRPAWIAVVQCLGVIIVAVVVMMLIGRLMKMRRRRAAGPCIRCGYDRRCSPGWCPECGAGVVPPLSTAPHSQLSED